MTIVVTASIGIGSIATNVHFRAVDSTAKISDEHIKLLIGEQLNSATEKVHADIKEQLSPILDQLKTLSELKDRVTRLEARFDQLAADQKIATKLQLDRLDIQLNTADKKGVTIDNRTLNDIGSALIQVTSSSDRSNANLAWKVLNHTLSYRSTIAHDLPRWPVVRTENIDAECLAPAARANGWLFDGIEFQHCTQHLDSIIGPNATLNNLVLDHVLFRDVRVIYSGGPLRLDGVFFVNCTFELDPSKNGRLLAEKLLASNDVTLHLGE
jgi:hypothetical protein